MSERSGRPPAVMPPASARSGASGADAGIAASDGPQVIGHGGPWPWTSWRGASSSAPVRPAGPWARIPGRGVIAHSAHERTAVVRL
ncbi:hypothetical protein HMPREF0682_2811 [Propionibacterium acidifaciens F0233]|uniref:Uncharacterized protein n=1 Tax=Propionibacterium acidifaciens F0233 TaxID=553198 RepID=U2S8F1_9ACTN|nr:hypothetical protein HMPREF0682_2811 [Propionibacterium acidifaciens F0233]